jgi:glucose uptake protein GlcU
MRVTGITLALSAMILVPVGIVHTADQSSRELVFEHNHEPSAVTLPQYIAVGLVGSVVMERIIQNGRETVIVDANVVSQLDSNQTISAN